MASIVHSLGHAGLRGAYERGELSPVDVVRQVYETLAAIGDPAIFIHLVPEAESLARARELGALPAEKRGALFGIPFAVKDNIDVAGLPTTAACPAFRYVATATAFAVQRLLDAGAILIGKTNLDQFATGLVGLRSPYGVPRNPFDAAFIPGGSSSGSGVAVGAGIVAFALGTDTAGSGRVPAAMNNIIGIKPTRGTISAHGVVPACRAQDCLSVFCGSVSEGVDILSVMAGADARDPYQRPTAGSWSPKPIAAGSFRFGAPRPDQLVIGDDSTRHAFERASQQLIALGGERVELDFSAFTRAARLLYEGAWVAQRLEAAGELFERDRAAIDPVVASILEGALHYTALDAYQADARLAALRSEALLAWGAVELLLVPTIPAPPTLEQVRADPLGQNSLLGTYTNFVNLLDLCAVAVPAGFGTDGVPRGVTLIGPAETDGRLLAIADALHHTGTDRRGATAHALPAVLRAQAPATRIVVAGAHLSGMALNPQLTSLGARLLERTFTAPNYRFYALKTQPPKPGLVRVAPGEPGHAIEVEVWVLSSSALGTFVSALPAPMCLGSVELASGERVIGFLCEPYALAGARDISELGGWRRFVAHPA